MRALAVAVCLSLGSCTYAALDKLPPPHETETHALAVELDRDIDLLFLVDDSPSMSDKQANLAGNFAQFINVLSAEGGLPSIHLGVATSDLGTLGSNGVVGPGIGTLGQGGCAMRGKDGVLQTFGAPINAGRPYLIDFQLPDGSRQKNYTGALTDAFSIMAKAGANGCGFEQTLEAMKRALDPTNTPNAGFVRPEAALAVMFITDEDDCSLANPDLLAPGLELGPQQSFRCTRYGITCAVEGATPDDMNVIGPKSDCRPSTTSPYLTDVAGYVSFLKQLKPDPSKLVVAGIMGTRTPVAVELRAPPRTTDAIPALAHSCTYIGGDGAEEVADPPVRIGALLDAFPGSQGASSICQRDLSGGLRQIAGLLKHATGDACLTRALVDLDPNTAGDQYECTVSITGDSPRDLPRCEDDAPNPPCWRPVTDPTACPAAAHQRIAIDGPGLLPGGTHLGVSCAVAR